MILIKTVRIYGFRGLQNLEIDLEQTTVLTGMNNTGKTSFLKALQLALGNRQFISQDDFFTESNTTVDKIIIDLKIVPVDEGGEQLEEFDEVWEQLFTTERIRNDPDGKSFVPLRTFTSFDKKSNAYKTQQFILAAWQNKTADGVLWHETDNGKENSFRFDEIPFFCIDAQRDILEDIRLKSSYLGRMISQIEYSKEDIAEIESGIKSLNDKATNSSSILSNIKTTLKELDVAMDNDSEGVEITPFTKKVRDLSKGLSIYYADQKDSFPMEYHGMGTRSWSSLLTLKSFIYNDQKSKQKTESPFFPIIAVEEPEAHLHPNAQKKLYKQINEIIGQKIISTHSPYIAASADLKQIRNLYKNDKGVVCGRIKTDQLKTEELRKIKRQVINTRGEIFFSKLIIFFEGETEEQAVPIFFEHHFCKTSVEMGINFIGVGGFLNYLPFLRFAEDLNIPWCILSDCETDAEKSVKKQFDICSSTKNITDVIVFLDQGNNYESQLIADGYSNEIRQSIINFELSRYFNNQHEYFNENHKNAKELSDACDFVSFVKIVSNYNDDDLRQKISDFKTQISTLIADEIVKSSKGLPPKILELFEKINNCFAKKQEEV